MKHENTPREEESGQCLFSKEEPVDTVKITPTAGGHKEADQTRPDQT
jgi:hypothetical protein